MRLALLISLAVLLLVVLTIVALWRPDLLIYIAPLAMVAAFVIGIIIFTRLRPGGSRMIDPERMERATTARQHELLRGTSMHLRDMNYRYSIRYDDTGRAPFTHTINTIILGFIPVIILDNRSDKQGEGYAAFPHDGQRWRGPGLPCVGNRSEAIAHAARCVSPLKSADDDDRGDGDDDDRQGNVPVAM